MTDCSPCDIERVALGGDKSNGVGKARLFPEADNEDDEIDDGSFKIEEEEEEEEEWLGVVGAMPFK